MEKKMNPVSDWIKSLSSSQTVPPFCVEVVMRDGMRYMLHSGGFDQPDTPGLTFKAWDFRSVPEEDHELIKEAINKADGVDLPVAEELHPKLDWGIVRASESEVAYVVEWHDRLWPIDPSVPIGFRGS